MSCHLYRTWMGESPSLSRPEYLTFLPIGHGRAASQVRPRETSLPLTSVGWILSMASGQPGWSNMSTLFDLYDHPKRRELRPFKAVDSQHGLSCSREPGAPLYHVV